MGLFTRLNNKQERFIMIHIPKTGGTSIKKVFYRNQYQEERICSKYSFQNAKRILKGQNLPGIHGKANEYKTIIGEKSWEKIFSFALVRNPWELMVSSYFWWLQIAPNSSKEVVREQAEKIRSLNNFTNFLNSPYGTEMLNDQRGNIKDWIIDEKNQIIVKFVGKVENISTDWQEITKMLNLKDVQLPHLNKSTHISYKNYYNFQTKKLIEHKFEWTIDQFKYRF